MIPTPAYSLFPLPTSDAQQRTPARQQPHTATVGSCCSPVALLFSGLPRTGNHSCCFLFFLPVSFPPCCCVLTQEEEHRWDLSAEKHLAAKFFAGAVLHRRLPALVPVIPPPLGKLLCPCIYFSVYGSLEADRKFACCLLFLSRLFSP